MTKWKPVLGVLLKRVVPVLAGLAVLIAVIAWLAGVMTEKIRPGESRADVRRIDPDRRADTYVVQEVFKDYTAEAVGTLKAASRTEVSARVMAPINKIRAGAGQTVAAGDVLVELDRRALETQLSQAKASLAAADAAVRQAENDYRRDANLIRSKVISQTDMDRSTANVQVSRANLEHAKQAAGEVAVLLSYTTIKAPKGGMVVDRLAEEGDMARPGEPLLILYDPTSLRLEVPVMENLAVKLRRGEEMTIQIDALNDRRIRAVIDEIVPQAEASSRSLLVKVRLPRSEDLFEGMFGRLIIPVDTRRHLCLHTGAIETIGQLQFVDVVEDDGTLQRRFIKTGRFGNADHREVLSGLRAGQRVLMKSSREGKANHGR